jgi:phosphohistidine swiveling domain-containing protein
MPCVLIVEFVDWQESLDLFRDVRQAIVDRFTTSNSAAINISGLAIPVIRGIRAASDITGITYADGGILPVYLEQFMVFSAEQYV